MHGTMFLGKDLSENSVAVLLVESLQTCVAAAFAAVSHTVLHWVALNFGSYHQEFLIENEVKLASGSTTK